MNRKTLRRHNNNNSTRNFRTSNIGRRKTIASSIYYDESQNTPAKRTERKLMKLFEVRKGLLKKLKLELFAERQLILQQNKFSITNIFQNVFKFGDSKLSPCPVNNPNQDFALNHWVSKGEISHELLKYWGKEQVNKAEEFKLMAIMLIQTGIRIWLIRHQSSFCNFYVEMDDAKNVIYIQSAIRRMLARQHITAKIEDTKKNELSFQYFCKMMQVGRKVGMFSRKYGTIIRRTIRFDSELKNFEWRISRATVKSVPLRSIFAISKDLSGYYYSAVRPTHPGWCFSIHISNIRALDFEAEDSDTFRHIFFGFQRLLIVFQGESLFHLKSGNPFRGGPSYIQYAIEKYDDRQQKLMQLRQLKKEQEEENSSQMFPWSANFTDMLVPSMMRHRESLKYNNTAFDVKDDYSNLLYSIHEANVKNTIVNKPNNRRLSNQRVPPHVSHSNNNNNNNINTQQNDITTPVGLPIRCYISSKVDELRFLDALQALKVEYQSWTKQAETAVSQTQNRAVTPLPGDSFGVQVLSGSTTENNSKGNRRGSIIISGISDDHKHQHQPSSYSSMSISTKSNVVRDGPRMNAARQALNNFEEEDDVDNSNTTTTIGINQPRTGRNLRLLPRVPFETIPENFESDYLSNQYNKLKNKIEDDSHDIGYYAPEDKIEIEEEEDEEGSELDDN